MVSGRRPGGGCGPGTNFKVERLNWFITGMFLGSTLTDTPLTLSRSFIMNSCNEVYPLVVSHLPRTIRLCACTNIMIELQVEAERIRVDNVPSPCHIAGPILIKIPLRLSAP